MAQGNVWAAIAQGASEIGGSLLSNLFHKRSQQRQFAHDRSQAEYAYGRDLDMWNRQSEWNRMMWDLQNQYNLPANQMQRLRDAGLNPNLVATQGSAGGTATSIQPANMPRYQQVRARYQPPPFQLPNVLGMYNSFSLANAQKDQLKANTELTEQKAITETIEQGLRAARRAGTRAENELKFKLADYSSDIAQLMLEQRRQNLRNSVLDSRIKEPMVGRTQSEAGLKRMEYEFFKGLGVKGMRDIAPFLQLLIQSYRGR